MPYGRQPPRPVDDPTTAAIYDAAVHREDRSQSAEVADAARDKQVKAGQARIAKLMQARRAWPPVYLDLANAVPAPPRRDIVLSMTIDLPNVRHVLDQQRVGMYRCLSFPFVIFPLIIAAWTIRRALTAIIERDAVGELDACTNTVAALKGPHKGLRWPRPVRLPALGTVCRSRFETPESSVTY